MFDRFRKKPPKAQKRARKPPTKKAVQKPYKLNDRRQEKICDGLAKGMTRTGAASLAGIARKTFYNWLEIPEFLQAVEMAEAMAEKTASEKVITTASTAWKYLVSKFPDVYSEKLKIEGEQKIIFEIVYGDDKVQDKLTGTSQETSYGEIEPGKEEGNIIG